MAVQWAEFYRFRGFQPLPSAPDKKRPLVRYAQWWEDQAPSDLFDRHPSTNLQVMTGRHWGLMVIDLDGEAAIEQWPKMAPACPRTWITHSGGGGRHVWFSIPRDLPPMPKARLWGVWDQAAREGKGDWTSRAAVERLCDRSLVMAPPSIHPKTGKRYRFLAGHSPKEIARPAMAPKHVLSLEPMLSPRTEEPSRISIARKAPGVPQDGRWDARSVLDSIPDKIALAAVYGLRVATRRPNAAGWCECHAIGRVDRDPSASFNPTTGRYWEPDKGSIGFFDLLVELGAYLTWKDACNDLGSTYCPWRKGA
jgi:hypothetical protein